MWTRIYSACTLLNSISQQASPGPADVHLDDLRVSGSGPQQPGVASVFQRAPVVRTAIPVQDVVAVETLLTADLVQVVVLRFVRDVEGPQCRLLQDNPGTPVLECEYISFFVKHLKIKRSIFPPEHATCTLICVEMEK